MRYDEIQWEDDEQVDPKNQEPNPTDDQSFADLLAASEGQIPQQAIRVGGKVSGSIISLKEDSSTVLVELDPLHTAVIDKHDLLDEAGELRYQAGDTVTAYVISRRGGEILLSSSMSQSSQGLESLTLAKDNQLPVPGKVVKENKGGFEVTVMGKSGFCPVSQMDTRYIQNKTDYVGKEYNFLIESIEEGGRNIVLSRAKLLKLEAREKIQELEAKISEDLILDGTVAEVRDYGAFVDLGGLDGFLHVSEMSYSRVNRASDFLSKADKIRVKVLKIETVDDKKRISLSMKAVEEDPWHSIRDEFKEGASYQGKVTKLESFGAFVEIRAGIEGLIHISEMSWTKRVHHPSDILAVGDTVNVRLLGIDESTKRISLSLKHVEEDPWVKAKEIMGEGTTLEASIVSLKGFGAILDLAPGVTGLLPMGVLKKAFGESYRKEASPPKQIAVVIRQVDDESQKILLTLPNIEEDDEEDESYKEYMKVQKQKATAPKTQGTFGELLAKKLQQSNKN